MLHATFLPLDHGFHGLKDVGAEALGFGIQALLQAVGLEDEVPQTAQTPVDIAVGPIGVAHPPAAERLAEDLAHCGRKRRPTMNSVAAARVKTGARPCGSARRTRRQTENTNFARPSGECPVNSKPRRRAFHNRDRVAIPHLRVRYS